MQKKPEQPQQVSHVDHYTTGNYHVTVQDERRKPVLYTADGKPLCRGLRRVGFHQGPKAE